MINPSKRTASIGEYYFSKKLQEIEELGNPPLINLGLGNPDMQPPQAVIATLTNTANQSDFHGYQPYRSSLELREAISKWYLKYFNVKLSPKNEILPLAGSKEGINFISLAFLNPGDIVLVPDPGYPTYKNAAIIADAIPKSYLLTEKNGWLPDLDQIRNQDLSKVKMMWVNYPHMPTGAKGNHRLFEKLVEFGLSNDVLICHDNPYGFILNNSQNSILSVSNAKETAIELNSLSKTFNMSGWRVGLMAGSSSAIQSVLNIRSHVDSGLFYPIQQAAIKALNSSEEWISELNMAYEKRRNIVYQILDKLGCKYSNNQSGMFVWTSIPYKYKNADEFSDWLLKKHHIFVTPGSVLGNQGKEFIRVSLCANEEILNQAFERL